MKWRGSALSVAFLPNAGLRAPYFTVPAKVSVLSFFITILASPGRSWSMIRLLSRMVRFHIWSTYGLHAVDFRAVAPVAGNRVVQAGARSETW